MFVFKPSYSTDSNKTIERQDSAVKKIVAGSLSMGKN
jgi:hypothetical protein